MLKRSVIIILVILLAGSLCTSGYFYMKWKNATTVIVPNPEEELEEVKEITMVVGSFIELPKDEEPKITTVVDREKLRNQSFFSSAENGDKVLIYSNTQKVILYRPSTKKVVEIAPMYLNKEQLEQAQAPTAPVPEEIRIVTIAYYNGSGITGRAGATEIQIKQGFTNTETVTIANAKGKYTSTIVVDVNGNMAVEAEGVAQLLGGQVQVLPPGEDRPDADLLIIVGE